MKTLHWRQLQRLPVCQSHGQSFFWKDHVGEERQRGFREEGSQEGERDES